MKRRLQRECVVCQRSFLLIKWFTHDCGHVMCVHIGFSTVLQVQSAEVADPVCGGVCPAGS